ncbi:DUF523 domain-containing protein [Desulfobacterales bacterium HSG16]|nr:DUF523 domain-containing protein [Desulfobacterales bacterium HSG16]
MDLKYPVDHFDSPRPVYRMIKILVSACLVGEPVRYNGLAKTTISKTSDNEILRTWLSKGRLVPVCPEIKGGLLVPRNPAEIIGEDGYAVIAEKGRIIDNSGEDVTLEFTAGAYRTWELAEQENVGLAIMTDGSPSCGSSYIYDGSFTGTRKNGAGVTAALLEKNGIRVFSQHRISSALSYLHELEKEPYLL